MRASWSHTGAKDQHPGTDARGDDAHDDGASAVGGPAASCVSGLEGSLVSSIPSPSVVESEVPSEASTAKGEKPTRIVVGRSLQPSSISASVIASCPKDENGNYLSLGSALHGTGNCTPCKWLRMARGCRDGTLCKLCHGAHDDLTRHGMRRMIARHGLQKRQYFEQGQGNTGVVKNTFVNLEEGDEDDDEAAPKVTRSNSQPNLA